MKKITQIIYKRVSKLVLEKIENTINQLRGQPPPNVPRFFKFKIIFCTLQILFSKFSLKFVVLA